MQRLQTGNFFGETNRTIRLQGLTLTDTEYTHDTVDWHYHENAYFTFILEGGVIEGNKKEVYECSPGSLLFHNWQDPHYNIKSSLFTRGFHIELEKEWLDGLSIDHSQLEGSRHLTHPSMKLLFYRIFRETSVSGAGKRNDPGQHDDPVLTARSVDDTMELSVQHLLGEAFTHLVTERVVVERQPPRWVRQIKELLQEEFLQAWTLGRLAGQLGIHPVHLSRDFSKYFHCSLGAYIRKLRIEKSLSLFPAGDLTLTDISYACGFSDQSHFVRCFRSDQGISPSAYRKLLLRK